MINSLMAGEFMSALKKIKNISFSGYIPLMCCNYYYITDETAGKRNLQVTIQII
ncbi:MAG: hypothetical protein ABI921_14305 [Panacibacter sp.]